MRYLPPALFALLVCCSGCSLLRTSSLTESAPLNSPSHTGRNQLSGQIGYGGKRGFDGSLSYALTNHVALGGSMFVNQQTFRDNPLPGWSDGYSLAVNSAYWEGQASYFRKLGARSTWALTGGYGTGSRRLRWLENQLSARYNRYFLQASANWNLRSNRQTGIGAKLHYTHYASASSQTTYAAGTMVLAGVPRGVMGLDVAQTVRVPISSVLAFQGQLGFYVPFGQVKLVTAGGSFNGYSNAGLIATAGLALSLPGKR